MPVESANVDPVDALLERLSGLPGVLVAFSGGVDSGFLLAAALRALPAERVLAVTAVSPSLPEAERRYASDMGRRLGARHLLVDTDEMSREGYRTNSTSRCYFCKAELLSVAKSQLEHLPAGSAIATGTNVDDLVAGFRPGIRAAAEHGAITPLADAGLDKQAIRSAARDWGLPIWDKPQAACLSSRIAYGIQISRDRLARVEAAEIALRRTLDEHAVPSVNLRVRDLGDSARIEVDAHCAGTRGPWRQAAVDAVLAAGFAEATIDARGFRSGSMNEGHRPPI